MGRLQGVLLCTDLDGTLLRGDKTISRENKEAIAHLQAEGGFFTFVTGRMPFFVSDIYNAVQPNAPIACINGGGIFDHRTGRYTWTQEAPREILQAHPLADRFDFIQSERTLFEILPKGVDKGSALPRLAAQVGVDPTHTVAVGDYYNDIAMLRAAGIGYAVANARTAVKEAADRLTVSNEEHAIAAIVEELESGKAVFA